MLKRLDRAREKESGQVVRVLQYNEQDRTYSVWNINSFGMQVGAMRRVAEDELEEVVRHVGGPKTGITKSKKQRAEEEASWRMKRSTKRSPVTT